MNTPIFDFVNNYANKDNIRMHMPGHKGDGSLGVERFDITEIAGADVLYCANGIIKQSEENASSLFDTALTLYSTEGSSLSIRAMLFLVKQYAKSRGKEAKIAAARNAHSTFVSAAAILDIEVDWLYPEKYDTVLSCIITEKTLDEYLTKHHPTAVYVTSPDYLGNILDIASLSKVCKKHGCLLITDNAHGAYLKFLKDDIHPITLGADICCDSAHKTLPVLTGGGYLHISKNADSFFSENAENAMKMFASTSPSYLILASLDKANEYISKSFRQKLEKFTDEVEKFKRDIPIKILGDEPLKITLCPKGYGYTGKDISEMLRENNIESEFSDKDFCVLMLSPENPDALQKLTEVLKNVTPKAPITQAPPEFCVPQKVLSLHDAVLCSFEVIPTQNAEGRVLACPTVNCPPAVSVAVCGEIIDKNTIEQFKYYGITNCPVIK